MKLFYKIYLSVGILLYTHLTWGQYTVSRTIPDFMDLSASCVVATYGNTENPFESTGIHPDRHVLITKQGTDPRTGDQLKLLPDGESRVIRLGNEKVSNEAESITYHFLVDPEKTVLLLKFAVVFEDPSHDVISQPRFVIRIMDSNGQTIEACAEYDVTARPEISGFQTYQRQGVPIRWRDWTNVGLDMSSFIGKEVQVQFTTYDCNLYGHFGYAYFTASCISNKFNLSECSSSDFTITAPNGFESYLWDDGDTKSSKQFTLSDEELRLNCQLTSATGCQFTLNGYVIPTGNSNSITKDTVIYDTICQGSSYSKYYYKLPPQDQPGNYTFENTFFDVENCNTGINTILHLKVNRRYFPLFAQICFREDYNENGFHILQPPVGIYRDTLIVPRINECDSIVCLSLTVNRAFTEPENIRGEKSPCVGAMVTYSVIGDEGINQYTWEFPQGYNQIRGQETATVTVQVTDAAQPGEIYFYGTNGCGNATVPFKITPYPGYWNTLIDTVCAGTEYHKHNFHIPAQDSNSYNSYVQYQKTTRGCDSITTLHLYNFEKPSIQIFTTDSILCSNKEITLHALSENPDLTSKIKIGDILCDNGEIISPEKYPTGGNTAQAIIFWLDASGQHGWAVSLNETGEELWAKRNAPIPNLHEYNNVRFSIKDTAGYNNTQTIRNTGDASTFPAAYAVDFADGWFLPAMGQLNKLYDAMYILNSSLATTGGDLFKLPADTPWRYWSSSQYKITIIGMGKTVVTYAWGIFHSGEIRSFEKEITGRIRAIRYF